MRTLCGSILLLTFTLAIPAAPAPEPVPLIGVGSGPLLFLNSARYRDELKLSEEQFKKLDALKAETSTTLGRLQEMSREERTKRRQEQNQIRNAGVARILTRKQLQRAEQIYLQTLGTLAFSKPEVAAALQFSEAQKEKMARIKQESIEERRNRREKEPLSRRQYADLLTQRDEKLLGVLTPAQRKKWKQLLGEPFKPERRRVEPQPAK